MVVLTEPMRRRSYAAGIRGVLAFLLLLALLCSPTVAAAPEMQAGEYRVKAAFLCKFGDYVEWPTEAFANSSNAFVIGVVGADPLADELARIAAGRTIGGRPVVVKKLGYNDPLAGLQVIFIGRSEGRRLARALDASKGLRALIVTESADGLKLGSMINFVIVSDKVRFDVALPPAEASGLKISSRLLAVARNVVESAP
jgi:YfiR/HmsC-like